MEDARGRDNGGERSGGGTSARKRRQSTSADDSDSAEVASRTRRSVGTGARAAKSGVLTRIGDTDKAFTLHALVTGGHEDLQGPIPIVEALWDRNRTCRLGNLRMQQLCEPGSLQEEILHRVCQRLFEVCGESVKGARQDLRNNDSKRAMSYLEIFRRLLKQAGLGAFSVLLRQGINGDDDAAWELLGTIFAYFSEKDQCMTAHRVRAALL
jgi:hypothetical protein